MTGEAHKRAMRKWRQDRSGHADVLHGLERAIAAHPAGGRSLARRRSGPTAVTRIPREKSTTGPDAA
jgi:hypothetical protein